MRNEARRYLLADRVHRVWLLLADEHQRVPFGLLREQASRAVFDRICNRRYLRMGTVAMTTTFTPEQLRIFAELGGWRRGAISGKWHRPGCEALGFECACSPSSPDFTDLAACFEVLEHFTDQRATHPDGYEWSLSRVDGVYNCDIMVLGLGEGDGDTKQAAIIAAVLAASENSHE